MATIGSLSINLSTDTSSFTAGMQKAASTLDQFSQSAGKAAGAGLARLASLVNDVAIKLRSMATNAMQSIDATAKLSDRLGVSTQSLVGLQYAGSLAGASTEEMNSAMQRMTRILGEAASSSGSAAGKLSELGVSNDALAEMGLSGGKVALTLQALGLNAKDLVSMGPEQSFLKIADAMKGLQNSSQQAQVAQELFGRGGMGMVNVLQQGSGALRAQMEEANKLGITYSRVDAAKVEMANQAIIKVQAATSALGTQLAIGLAPFIEAIESKFLVMKLSGTSAADKVAVGIEWVGKGLGFLGDVADAFVIGFKTIELGGAIMAKGIADGLNTLTKIWQMGWDGMKLIALEVDKKIVAGMQWLVEKAQAVAKYLGVDLGSGGSQFLGNLSKQIEDQLKPLEDKFSKQKGSAVLQDFSAGMSTQIDEMTKSIKDSFLNKGIGERVRQFFADIQVNATKKAQEIEQQAKKSGAVNTKLQDVNKDNEHMQELANKAKQFKEQMRTPDQIFTDKIKELQELKDKGFINQSEMNRGLLDAKKNLADAVGMGNNGRAGALEKGSAAAYSATLKSGDIQRNMQQNTRDLLKEAKLQTSLLQRVADKAGNQLAAAGAF